MMATAEEMAIKTTWLLSLEIEKAAETQTAAAVLDFDDRTSQLPKSSSKKSGYVSV